jgi:hypothetical protein
VCTGGKAIGLLTLPQRSSHNQREGGRGGRTNLTRVRCVCRNKH